MNTDRIFASVPCVTLRTDTLGGEATMVISGSD
jgi:hypothetical protein